MATVNINSNWSYRVSPSSSQVVVNTTSSTVQCYVPESQSGFTAYAKIYIPISNISQYESITLKYSNFHNYNGASFTFGVFDSTGATSSAGVVSDHSFSSDGGTVSIGGLSSLSGTKYVGFRMEGNAYFPYVGDHGRPNVGITITSLTATKRNCTLTYDANGGSGVTESQTASGGSTVILQSNSFTAPTSKIWTLTLNGNGGNDGSPTFKSNYFANWREGAPSGAVYSEGDSYILNGDTTMYARWGTKYIWGTATRDGYDSEGYTVTFDANGGTCNTDFLTSKIITSYNFAGWGNSESNPTTIFKSDVEYGQTSNYTAYAIWSPITTNGSIHLPTPTRNGYEFLGWAPSESDLSGVTGEYTPTGDVTLYAIWKIKGQVYICNNNGDFSPYQVLIYDSSGWNQYIPYIYTESGWEVYSG